MSVRHALLALLAEGPKYGLQLRQEFEERTGTVWPLNVGQVYTTLQRLERDGLVASDEAVGDRTQRRFVITAAGQRELAEWLRTPPTLTTPPREELVIKVLVAARLPGVDLDEVLQVHRRKLMETMQQYTNLRAEAPASDVEFVVVVDAEIYRIEGLLRWLDSAGARLSGRTAPPTATSSSAAASTGSGRSPSTATGSSAGGGTVRIGGTRR